MKDKRIIAIVILGLLLLLIIGIVFFSRGQKGNSEKPTDLTQEETTTLKESQDESSSSEAENLTTAHSTETVNTTTHGAAGKHPSPSKQITDQYSDVTMVASFASGDSNHELIEKDDYYLVTNADFVHIRDDRYDVVATSDTYIRKDATIIFYSSSQVNDEFVYEDIEMTFPEYLEFNYQTIRAVNFKVDDQGWIISFTDSYAG